LTCDTLVYNFNINNYFKLTDHCECEDLLKDDQESYNYAIRVGWSLDTCNLQLGMDDFSFAYCSNGKKLKNSVYEDYGESFQKSDSVAAYIVNIIHLK
jgi:heterogeneous nuclear ribonucleoprotein U-like protein 1